MIVTRLCNINRMFSSLSAHCISLRHEWLCRQKSYPWYLVNVLWKSKGHSSHTYARHEVLGAVTGILVLSEAETLGVCQDDGVGVGWVCSLPQTFLSRMRNPMMIYNHLDYGLYKSHLGLMEFLCSPSIKGQLFVCVV